MGVLSDFFIAADTDLTDEVREQGPLPHMPALESKGVDVVMLGTLHTIVLGADLTDIDAVVSRGSRDVGEASNEGPWLFRVDDELVRLVATAAPVQRKAWKEAWRKTEEWEMLEWPAAGFETWFRDFVALLGQAMSSHRGVFLWVCL